MSEFRGHSFVIKAGMMKATSLKRLAALEQAAIPNTRPPLRLTEVRRFAHYDQSAFWNEDQTVLSRYGLFDGPVPPGSLRVLVMTVHPTSREDWLAGFGLDDDDELEAFEERRINEELRREREAKAQAEQERLKLAAIHTAQDQRTRAVIGFDREGQPVYDDDPHMMVNWSN